MKRDSRIPKKKSNSTLRVSTASVTGTKIIFLEEVCEGREEGRGRRREGGEREDGRGRRGEGGERKEGTRGREEGRKERN
jgi:hypothetical protein